MAVESGLNHVLEHLCQHPSLYIPVEQTDNDMPAWADAPPLPRHISSESVDTASLHVNMNTLQRLLLMSAAQGLLDVVGIPSVDFPALHYECMHDTYLALQPMPTQMPGSLVNWRLCAPARRRL